MLSLCQLFHTLEHLTAKDNFGKSSKQIKLKVGIKYSKSGGRFAKSPLLSPSSFITAFQQQALAPKFVSNLPQPTLLLMFWKKN